MVYGDAAAVGLDRSWHEIVDVMFRDAQGHTAQALPLLDESNILKKPDRPHARKLLTAAALTYVSASLMSLLNIARWIAILRR